MTVEILVGFVSAVVAIVFQYFPFLKEKYGALADNYQRLVMLGMLVLVVAGAYALSCAKLFDYFVCGTEGLIQAGKLLLAAIMTNQTVFMLLPDPKRSAWKA